MSGYTVSNYMRMTFPMYEDIILKNIFQPKNMYWKLVANDAHSTKKLHNLLGEGQKVSILLYI